MPDIPKKRSERAPTEEERIDESGEDSFPASDPPSSNPGTPGRPARKRRDEAE